MTTFAIATLGCKVNTYESQGYESALLQRATNKYHLRKKQMSISLIHVR